jgi:hypothetical protein
MLKLALPSQVSWGLALAGLLGEARRACAFDLIRFDARVTPVRSWYLSVGRVRNEAT